MNILLSVVLYLLASTFVALRSIWDSLDEKDSNPSWDGHAKVLQTVRKEWPYDLELAWVFEARYYFNIKEWSVNLWNMSNIQPKGGPNCGCSCPSLWEAIHQVKEMEADRKEIEWDGINVDVVILDCPEADEKEAMRILQSFFKSINIVYHGPDYGGVDRRERPFWPQPPIEPK